MPVPRLCPAEEICRVAMCACPPGRTRCGTACVDLEVDPAHCGDCDTTCPPENRCLGGDCIPPMPPPEERCLVIGFIRCEGECINPLIDPRHCGRCNNNCPAMTPSQVCLAGMCGLRPAAPDGGILQP